MKTRCLLTAILGFAAAVQAAQSPTPAPEATEPSTSATTVPAPTSPAATTPPAAASTPGKKTRVLDLKNASAQPPPPLSPRFQQVRDHIDELFRHRHDAPPVLDARSNPFRPAGAVAPVVPQRGTKPADDAPPPVASATDLQLLQQAAATLKVAGTIRIGGVDHLSINQTAYKEGDVINVRVKGQSVVIRVKNISRFSYTLSLNSSELSVKY